VGRRGVLWAVMTIMFGGLLLTLSGSLLLIVAGIALYTFGFFATHSVASSWVSSRAQGRRGQAAAMYLLAYYLGSSTFGALIGLAYQYDGWPAAAAGIALLFVLGALTVSGVREPRRPA
jgi:YNFM family putative membrane transporter